MNVNGLLVRYDGKKYIINSDGIDKEYPIGGLACDYSRFEPDTLKDIIVACPRFNDPSDNIEVLDDAWEWFYGALKQRYNLVTLAMVSTEMGEFIAEVIAADEKGKKTIVEKLNNDQNAISESKVKDYILKDTGLNAFEIDTIGALFLAAYYNYVSYFVLFRRSLDYLVEDEGTLDDIDVFLSFYGKDIEFQHIDYKLALINGKFAELYIIKTSLSLILFETAHILENDALIKRCKNCHRLFVTTGRTDAIYCTYSSPQDSNKTCKDIGAQVSRSNKEKNDIITKEYRKTYMRYKMLTRRHPENEQYNEILNRLIHEIKDWRNKLAHGVATTEDFFMWLSKF